MQFDRRRPSIDGRSPVPVTGAMVQMHGAFAGADLVPLANDLQRMVDDDPTNCGALMDLGTLCMILGQMQAGLNFQARALAIGQAYREQPGIDGRDNLNVLAIAVSGDFMANTPMQFLIRGAPICLDVLYVVPGQALPESIDGYDVAIVIAGESDRSLPVLERIVEFVEAKVRVPLLNNPRRVMQLSREEVSQILNPVPGICCPRTVRIKAAELAALGDGAETLANILPGGAFPLIARPVDSHAGKGLERIETPSGIAAYMAREAAEVYYISSFVDYRNNSGHYVKYRVSLVDGEPLICHMAISDHWMIHYLNAGMRESGSKRDAEAAAFATFDTGFAGRHGPAFQALREKIGLDYFVMDCAETPDGRLLVFEIDTAMIVHDMDPVDLFPYKPAQMQRIFTAFQTMLFRAAGRQIQAP